MNVSFHPKVSASLVQIVRGLDSVLMRLSVHPHGVRSRQPNGKTEWPAVPGAFYLGDPYGCIAVCTLANGTHLAQAASIPGVAIAGRLYTANLGIEKMVRNLLANPRIRFLVLCGKDSPFFQSGQAVASLWANGITPEGRIIGAQGHFPIVRGISSAQIDVFRKQIELVNRIGESDLAVVAGDVTTLAARNPGQFSGALEEDAVGLAKRHTDQEDAEPAFFPLKPGGRREPLSMDPKGFFIISLDPGAGEIVVHHYFADHKPAHQIRGHSGEAILLGLLREGLVSQMSHAGYLGAELSKAETALRLNLLYEQDRPLRSG